MIIRRLFVPIALTFCRSTSGISQKMDALIQLENLSWFKPDWSLPSKSKETSELVQQCANISNTEVPIDVDVVIRSSNGFPVPFPIQTIRLEVLQKRRPIEKLKKNIVSTYPLIHERVLLLMTHFLIYKREYGSPIEKDFYKDMKVTELIDRILKKRAITFLGADDAYILLSGQMGSGGWETIGTMQQKPPLVLEDVLSYDELKLSAYVFVSGHTECINDGDRYNAGKINEDGIEKDAVIIGAIGPRFERQYRMDNEDIVITATQNCPENGYGVSSGQSNDPAKAMWRKMWSEFFQVPSYTYHEISTQLNSLTSTKNNEKLYTERFIRLNLQDIIFDNEVYYKRISIIAETVLLEADARACEEGRPAYVNVIGCGLGVWRISDHQSDVYVLTFLERTKYLLRKGLLQNVSDVNFSYITPSSEIQALFSITSNETAAKKIFFESGKHPRGGINVQILKRQPSSKLTGEDEGKLLVMTYPWDGNAHPGNEFWTGSLTGSGDPAAACSTQVSELHNAHINRALSAQRTHIAYNKGLCTIRDYCNQVQ